MICMRHAILRRALPLFSQFDDIYRKSDRSDTWCEVCYGLLEEIREAYGVFVILTAASASRDAVDRPITCGLFMNFCCGKKVCVRCGKRGDRSDRRGECEMRRGRLACPTSRLSHAVLILPCYAAGHTRETRGLRRRRTKKKKAHQQPLTKKKAHQQPPLLNRA